MALGILRRSRRLARSGLLPSTRSRYVRRQPQLFTDTDASQLHPWCQQKDAVKYCQDNNIVVEAYCPLVRNQKASDPTLQSIAQKHGVTDAQVLVRWSLQRGFVPLPKSDTPSRIAKNADLYGFQLDGADMTQLDGLDQAAEGALVQAVSNE